MKPIKIFFFIWLALCSGKAGFCHVADSLVLSNVLQSGMVLQQNKPFKVWGKASPGKEVHIQADWMQNELTVVTGADGLFLGIITIPEAKKGDFGKHELKVKTVVNEVVLDDLLIGDVWFCSGQSNMQFAIKEMKGAEQELNSADQANIRLLNVGLNFSAQPLQNINGKWEHCSAQTVKGFSAVGYTFGKELYERLNIPIGIIFSGIGASSVQAYIPQDVLAADSLLNRVYLQPYLASPKSKEVINGGFSFEKVVRPFLLYNAMIHPFVKLSIKGICWYQGESNHLERESYVRATQQLIKSWRNNFAQDNLPFYYVQIAPFYHDKEDPNLAYDAFFREAQQKVSELNNTEMVLTMDVGEMKDLHPKDKKPIGLRLAKTALNRCYGQLEISYQGPSMDYVTFEKNNAVIYFKPETLSGGLATKDGKAPAFFYLAGKDRIFYPADAQISGNSIQVKSSRVKHPEALRYAFFNYPVTNLQNGAGFPALPFRTDSYPEQ